MIQHSWWVWGSFLLLIVLLLAFDLGVVNRKSHEIKFKEAVGWTIFWIGLALIFNIAIWLNPGDFFGFGADAGQRATEFLTAYVVEKSLSVDNIFVFLYLFTYFQVANKYRHRVLFYGILGAVVIRGIMIYLGVALLNYLSWMMYVFGAILIYTAWKLWSGHGGKVDPEKNPVLRFVRRFVPVTPEYHEQHFFVRLGGKLFATPLFVVLIMLETTDVVFAVDSIPAVIAISKDPFIVFTSNIFAILGLRALFFCVHGFLDLFHYLNYGLALILAFVGCKMIIAHHFHTHLDPRISLGVIAVILTVSIAASLLWPKEGEGDPIAETEAQADHDSPRTD